MDRMPTAPLAKLTSLMQPGVLEVLACAITAVVYLATLSFGFVYDDVPQILKNPAVHSWRFMPEYFTSHVWAAIYPTTSGNYYRPLFLLWLRLNYAIFGTNAAGWHVTSVACHVLATWLTFGIARRLTGDRLIAFLTALIFGVDPVHIENVAWISGVTDPLLACFLLGSFSVFLTSRELPPPGATNSRGTRLLGVSLLLFALALLSKETAAMLPALVFAYLWIMERDEGTGEGVGKRFAAAIRTSAPYLLVVLLYAVIRFRALGEWSHPTISIPWRVVFATWPSVLWFYARHLFLPLRLSEFYPLEYVTHFSVAGVLLPLAMFATVAFAAFLLIRSLPDGTPPAHTKPIAPSPRDVAWFAAAVIVVPLLPVLDLRSLTVGDTVHDRYLYLPSLGFALLVALFIRELARRLPPGQRTILPVAFSSGIVLVFAALTVSQQMQWASDILLYSRGVESAPANITVRENLANALLEANQPAQAIPLYVDVLNHNPAFWASNYNLGFAYYKIAEYTDAETFLRRAIGISPTDADQYIYLALAQLHLNKLSEAEENALQAIARNPHASGYHFGLGMIYETEEEPGRAAAEFRAELEEHPDSGPAAAELRKLGGIPSAQ